MSTVKSETQLGRRPSELRRPSGGMEMLSRSWAVFGKDVTCEFRTRYAVNAIVLFAVTTLLAVSFAIGGVGVTPAIQASLLWVIIYFSALSGLSRSFVREEESRTASALRLSAAPGAVFGGKLIFNIVMLGALELVIVPLYVGMMGVEVSVWSLFVLVMVCGSLGLAVAATVVAAIVSRANAKGALFAVLSFPILLPMLVVAINGTKAALSGSGFGSGADDLKLLVSFTGIMFVVSAVVFKFVWED